MKTKSTPMVFALAIAFSAPAFASKTASEVQAKPASPEAPLAAVTVFGEKIGSANVGRSYLDHEDIERQQAGNVAALLDTLPGVDLSGTSRPSGQTLNIWGFNKVQDVKVIVDGAPKGFEKYRQGSIFIEPELIKQIEVNKGPHTSLYGNGGFGGVITIETKDAKDLLLGDANLGTLLKYSYQSNNTEQDATAAIFGRSEDRRFDGLVYFTQRESDDLRKPNGDLFRFSAIDAPSSLAKLNIRLTEDQLLTLTAMQSRSSAWAPFAALGEDAPAPTEAEINKFGWDEAWKRKVLYRDQEDTTYSAKWRFNPSPLINMQASYGYSKTNQHDQRSASASVGSFLGSLGNESWATYTDKLAELRNESMFSSGPFAHVLSVGTQWHDNQRDTLMYYPSSVALKNSTYNFGYFQPYYMPAGQQKTQGVYVQDAVSYGDVTLTAALRYDHITAEGVPNRALRYNSPLAAAGHDYSEARFEGFSPRLGLFWKANSNLSLFADISQTWRAPTIDELYSSEYYVSSDVHSSTPGTSRALDVERITAARLGAMWNQQGLLSANDDAQLRFTLYQNRVADNIGPRLGVLVPGYSFDSRDKLPPALSNYRNLSGFKTEGLEIESFYNTRYFFANASLSMQYGRRNGSQRDPWGEDQPVASIAPDKLIMGLGFKLPEQGITAGWQGKFVGEQDKVLAVGNVYRLPPSKGYGLHTLFASWQGRGDVLRGLEARLTIDNVFNRDYQPYLSEGVTGVGRNYKISVSKIF
ncbi:TonB-dependent hemoglobin/transferrin/lactoferrin family receptor [Iodobacter sp. CM08]|uniref:TonB-dependent hemoglobin/transferrin/lactoferrin family receptor n=1 Tax=Iodobacter sp. CM08 TaxID=3085902 RepID=UPI002981024D|nr:TonB-dependent hemoglobin/transferrin/lactoferrin family receptor [Iodobacter sp. CM08]MDW5417787.1 TonB-dependent hemoglobin/transferrin/lactoferrin family receptor [Iodobacter sp. CM08]